MPSHMLAGRFDHACRADDAARQIWCQACAGYSCAVPPTLKQSHARMPCDANWNSRHAPGIHQTKRCWLQTDGKRPASQGGALSSRGDGGRPGTAKDRRPSSPGRGRTPGPGLNISLVGRMPLFDCQQGWLKILHYDDAHAAPAWA